MTEAIINTIKDCCKEISESIRDGNTENLSSIVNANASGDIVKKLDYLSNSILKNGLLECYDVRAIGSEEEDELVYTDNKESPYLVCFDPLDGSSNIDVNITVGTIFAIYEYNNNKITDGHNIVTAGYCLYGGSTQLIIANEKGVKMYALRNDKFELINNDMKIKPKGNIYSINESNKHRWFDNKYRVFVERCLSSGYTTRWVGSLVADAHRTLIKGGLFTYPCDSKSKEGKLRVLYEAYPFAYIFEMAGGYSSDGHLKSLLDMPFPSNPHQKTGLVLAGQHEYEMLNNP